MEMSEAPATRGRSRKYEQTLAQIYQAAVEVFAAEGLSGATTQAIAEHAGLSKPQLHYYIESKEALYRQVLQDILDDWIGVFGFSDEAFGPRKVLGDLVRRKMQFSFEHPLRSRIFTAEMMRGGMVLRPMMDAASKRRTQQAEAVIRHWIARGEMADMDPMLLLFHIWAVTQFYADHAAQVRYFLGARAEDVRAREALVEEVVAFVLRGAAVR